MEIKVTVELGAQTCALINGLTTKTIEIPKAVVSANRENTPAEKPKRTAAKPKEETKAEAFESLDDDAKLETIKAEITKHTKKGKSADIKALLADFDANRASELSTEDYNAFYSAVKRYGAGESVDAIIDLN